MIEEHLKAIDGIVQGLVEIAQLQSVTKSQRSEELVVLVDRCQEQIAHHLNEIKAQVQRLHDQYAHEGGRPQILTAEILQTWLRALDIPSVNELYQTSAPKVFYATFGLPLRSEHVAQMGGLNIEVIDPNSALRNRYMLKWQPPRNDER